MAIKFKFAKIADNISEEDFVCVDKEGKKKATVRPILLSNKTVGRDELAERISRKYPRFSSEAHTIIGVMLESIKDVLKDGEIVHIKGFGSFSVNAQFKKHTESNLDETSRANSLEIKNVVFKADRQLKNEIDEAGFEKFNPVLNQNTAL